MKIFLKIILSVFLLSGFMCAQPQDSNDTITPQPLIIGQWINQNQDVLDFTVEKEVYLNGEKIGLYREMVDAGSIYIVDLNHPMNDQEKRFYEIQIDKNNQVILIDTSAEGDQIENKIFTRTNNISDQPKKKK